MSSDTALPTTESSRFGERALVELEALAREAGSDQVAVDVGRLAERIREGRFYVACVGQFKRGKSTLLNALIGDAVLPVGVVPVTAVITVVRYGEQRGARVRFADGDWRSIEATALAEYVTEEGNPGNAKGVTGAEVFVPATLLTSGLCLVDTPGVGSVFGSGTQATQEFVPHIDAAIVVLGADPPISAEELALVRDVAAGGDDVMVVLNKADRVSPAERAQAIAFTKRVLSDRLRWSVGSVFEISATGELAGNAPYGDWDALLDAIGQLASRSGSALVARAQERGISRLGERLMQELDERIAALERPLAESEQRIEALRSDVAEGERSLADLTYILTGERHRLSEAFVQQGAHFLGRALPAAREELVAAIRQQSVRSGPALRREAERLTAEIAGRWLDSWLAEEQPVAEELYRRAAARFNNAAAQFLEQLAASGAKAFTALPDRVDVDLGFRTGSRLFFQLRGPMTLLGSEFRVWLLDTIRPAGPVRRSIERSAANQLTEWLQRNATRIVNDLDEQVLESCRRLEAEIRTQLRALTESAERALTLARERHAQGSDAVLDELNQIKQLQRRLRVLVAPAGEE